MVAVARSVSLALLWILVLLQVPAASVPVGEGPPRDGGKVPARTILPHTSPDMRSAGFWIASHPAPDRVVMSAPEIDAFNARVRDELRLTRDVAGFPPSVAGADVAREMRRTLERLRMAGLYTADGGRAGAALFAAVERNMRLEALPARLVPRFGLVCVHADQRFLPGQECLSVVQGDVDFDEVQNSALDAGTPVAVLHRSRDGQWAYVAGPCSEGWVEDGRVAECGREGVTAWEARTSFALVMVPRADVFWDAAGRRYGGFVQMGTRLPLLTDDGKASTIERIAVSVPSRGSDGACVLRTAWLDREDVHEGWLPYTVRTIYRQAFRLLDRPYGWGGADGEQDCSRFVQMVFATVGLRLPRDSKDQARVGARVAAFDSHTSDAVKLETLLRADGAVTVLTMKGHIMLYLGMADGRPYAIHAVNAYGERTATGERLRVIHRVAVSDLFLGEGSSRGNLLRFLRGIRSVTQYL